MDYDVIIVGSGAGGAVLANRLTESPSVSVLLIEAGPDFPSFELMPDELKYSYTNYAFRKNATFDWGYSGTASSKKQTMMVPRARVIGGCTSHNGPGPNFYRGAPEDYDSWASSGNTEWSFDKVLPYFIKLETQKDISSEYHGTDGPVQVRRHKQEDWSAFQTAGFQAMLALGFPEHPDVNHPEYTGAAPRTENNIDGVRQSTLLCYINPIRERQNLTILPNTLVTRVLFSGQRAVAVQAERNGESICLEGGEIVLSAGAVASPQLLMVSGVGPGDELLKNDVEVLQSLPGVGKNLRDHVSVPVNFQPKDNLTLDPYAPRQQNQLAYTASNSNLRNDMVITPISFAVDLNTSGPMDAIGVGFSLILYLAKSSGELTLRSPSIHTPPKMDFRYWEDPCDLMRMREAIKICLELAKHSQVAQYLDKRIVPSDDDLMSDKMLDDWLLRTGSTPYHQAGTCKMGPASDGTTVVDQFCKVHGLDGLRVVDASIMPDVVRANTNATTLMIGERVADLMKAGL